MGDIKLNTPIYNFVKRYNEAHISRLHMPGHKGQAFLGCESIDITEINGADVLSMADGIIKESQDNAAMLFGAGASFYSTEGSSQCIKAMLEAVRCDYVRHTAAGRTRPFILAARNVHKAFVHALALLDIEAEWIIPENADGILSLDITSKTH